MEMGKDKIDLGVQDQYHEANAVPAAMPPPSEVRYPTFHYSGPKELDLPDHGMMMVCFRKISETSSRRPDGSHWYECSVELHHLSDIKGKDDEEEGSPNSRHNEAEDALDRIAHEEGYDEES